MRTSYGGVRYASKKAVLARAGALLAAGEIDEAFLLDLLEQHPEAAHKIGCGVRRFFIGPDGWGKSCFHLERLDGSTTDWSVRACLMHPTRRAEAMAAFREEITPQILAFRDAAFASGPVLCAISGELLTSDRAHVDHVHPLTFVALVDSFCAGRGFSPADVDVLQTADNDTREHLAGPALAAEWRAYHAAHAQLRILAGGINCRLGARAA